MSSCGEAAMRETTSLKPRSTIVRPGKLTRTARVTQSMAVTHNEATNLQPPVKIHVLTATTGPMLALEKDAGRTNKERISSNQFCGIGDSVVRATATAGSRLRRRRATTSRGSERPIFDDEKLHLSDIATGQQIPLHRDGNLFYIAVATVPSIGKSTLQLVSRNR
jgi:hypothetical protein